ncbi:Y_Y_Y domain-containing protein [Tenacibaculum sp. 190524A02b]
MIIVKKITIYIYLILFSFSSLLYAQHPVYTHLTEKDGLPDIEFYGSIEDKEGFIWLAANKGLFRYDGKEFKNYTHPDKRGLSVFGLKLDNKGRVWCNNISGQFFFIENDKLTLFTDLKEYAKGQLADYLFYKGSLIASNLNYIAKIDLVSKEKKILNGKDWVASVFKENDTLFYLSKKHFKYNLVKDKFIQKVPFKSIDSIEGATNRFIHKDKRFVFLFNHQADSTKVDKTTLLVKKGRSFKKVVLPEKLKNTLASSFYDAGDELWIGTEKGVIICEYRKDTLFYKNTHFKGKYVTGFLKDRSNNFWYTTHRSGVFIVPNMYLKNYELEDTQENISAMCKVGQNSLLFGSTNGRLAVINTKDKQVDYIDLKVKEKVFAVIEIAKDIVLVSFASHSIVLSLDTGKYRRYPFNGNIKDISFIEKGKVVKASYSSASIMSTETQEMTQRLGSKRSYSTHYSKASQKIYVGFVDGVKEYNKDYKIKTITYNNKPIFAVDIDETNNGTVWFSTFKDGIIGFKKDGSTINFTEENGLLSNLTSVIKSDGDFLWVSTNIGVQILNTNTGKFRNLTRRDGINSFNISDISIFKDEVFFSSNKGVFQVNKNKVFKETVLLNFNFTEILIDDQKVAIKKFYKLNPTNNKIQFKFHTNGFLSEDNLEYQYRLLGVNGGGKWNVIDKNVNQLTFINLAAGEYELELKAVELNDEKETAIKRVRFNVPLPFYKEWWFIIGVFLLILVIVWYSFTNRIKRIRLKQEELLEKERIQKQLVSSKLESLQSQMNPHFIFNALNSIQNLVLKENKYEAYDYLTKFSMLIRENLNMSRKSFVNFEEELKLIIKYLDLEKLRFKNEFTYEIKGSSEIGDIKIPTMIIQPYIENAIKHGLLHKNEGEKKIAITFLQKETLVCIIQDNGVGIEIAKKIKEKSSVKRESFSTKAIQDRMLILKEYYKTDIGVDYISVKEGTKVVIKIPYTSI